MTDIKTLCARIDERKEELYALLCDLIHINSENFGSHGNEKECSEYIAGLCRELGLETETYSPLDLPDFENHPDYLAGRALENRPNVTARWKGAENVDELMLMGHVDTVPIGDPANWTFEPLAGVVRDGCIWGRGACDDKYALATALFIIRLLQEQGFVPRRNLIFTGYCDEEKGGSNGALAAVLRYPTTRIVNMDCKNFEIWHCASGGQSCKYCYHTEKPVDNAAVTAKAIPIVMEVMEDFAARRRAELSDNRFYKGTVIPATSMRYMGFRAGDRGADLGVGEVAFTVYTDKTKDEIYAEYREMEAILSRRLAPLGIIGDGFKPTTRFFHYGYAEPDCQPIRDMQAAALEATGREVRPCGSCLSDLSVILKYGSGEAYGFGIGRDFDEYGGAHQPDEFIECDKLVEYAKIIAAYVLKVLG
ncbi:MAG: M20 family metallopeptidase [Ruminococcaceae bacterium]|nr:M20 family metallopeptidase [Oscillospiraceae bacterium]